MSIHSANLLYENISLVRNQSRTSQQFINIRSRTLTQTICALLSSKSDAFILQPDNVSVLNNGSVEHTEEYCPSDILEALRRRRWVITSDEQVCMTKSIHMTLEEGV